MKIIDNFLNEEEFDIIKKTILGEDFPWFFIDSVGTPTDFSDAYFIHTFYQNFSFNSNFSTILQPLLKKLDVKALIRCRALRYVGKEKFIEHAKHTDFNFSHNVCVFYINTNNGFTRLHDGSCVNSVENRALISDGSMEHNSSNCTDTNSRLVFTINYF
jgi:hypothetical protein